MVGCALLRIVLVLGTVGLLAGCSFEDEDPAHANLVVTIDADAEAASPLDPVELMVTAWNSGESPVAWGPGSSTCQLRALAYEEGSALPVVELRVCLNDVAPQGLGPGEFREERWNWDGRVLEGIETRSLAPGRYVVRGVAGPQVSVDSTTIEVLAASP